MAILLLLHGIQATTMSRSDCVTVDGHECKFPFTYDGKKYTECAPAGSLSYRNWCATRTDTNGNYVEGEYGRCNAGVVCGMTSAAEDTSAADPSCLTESGPKTGVRCVFPFTYGDTTYNGCTNQSHEKEWCATKTSSSGDYISGEWGNCKSDCNLSVCPDGYKYLVGRNARTSIETKLNVKTLDDCGDLCDFNEKCTSFMWSPSTAKCMVYDGEEQDESASRDDFRVCKMEFTEVKEKTVEDLVKNSASNVQRAAGIIGGIGEIIKIFTPDHDKPLNMDTYLKLTQTKSSDGLVMTSKMRQEFSMGTNFRKVKVVDGKTYFKEKKMSTKGIQKKLRKFGGALSSLLTIVSPIFLVGEIIWGNTEDQNHIAVMGKMEELDKKIGHVVTKIREQTKAIDYFIKHNSFITLAQSLETIGDAYQKKLEKDGSAEDLLERYYGDFSHNVNELATRIGPYFQSILDKTYGKCVDLADIRLWLDMTLLKATLGAYMGCTLATTAKLEEQGKKFNKDTDCLMKTEKENIWTIKTEMTKILSKCNRDHVITWTRKYIKDKLTSGNGEEKKNKLKAFLDNAFPNIYYLIAVQGEKYDFKAYGDIHEKSTDRYSILVDIATKKSTCQSSALSTSVLGADFGATACNNLYNLSPIYKKFSSYYYSHVVSSYAVYAQGSYAYKGIRPCVGSVTCTRQVRCTSIGRRIMMRFGMGGMVGAQAGKAIMDLLRKCPETRRAHYIAVNQWKCNVARNGTLDADNCQIQN